MRYFRRWPSSCHVSSGRHIGWIRPNWILPNSVWCDISVGGHPGVTSVQGSILAEYDQIKTHVLTWNHAKFRYPKSLHIRGIRDWDIASKLRFDAIYPSVAILVSRQFRAAYWLITTKTLGEEETFLTQSFSFLKERQIMYHSQYMWKSCSDPTPNGPHFGWRGVTSVQGGISADYNQIDTHGLRYKPAKFGYISLVTCELHVIELFLPNSVLMLYIRRRPSCVTQVQGGILADYDQNFSRGWDSPDTKFHLPQRLRNYVPLTVYVENLVLSQRLTDPILADMVLRQFRAAFQLITTKLIHMSWSQILPGLVTLNRFTFELYVIEQFLPNSVLMLYIRWWPSWRHASSGLHIGWLQPNL